VKLDAIDLRILSVLQQDGRITKLKLAEAVNLSASACWSRLKRLEAAGVIAGYSARLDPAAVGRAETVLTEITLSRHRRADFDAFERYVLRLPEVVECHATGGGIDYLVKFMVADIGRYQRLMDELLSAGIGIERYFTYVVTRTVKAGGPLPFDQLLAERRGA
jgi:Lrp/AsnC family transcriptional regulator, regulator of ectoine-degradation genes